MADRRPVATMSEELIDLFSYHDLTSRLTAYTISGGRLRGAPDTVIVDAEPQLAPGETETLRVIGLSTLIAQRSSGETGESLGIGLVAEGKASISVTTERLILMWLSGGSQLGQITEGKEIHAFSYPLDLIDGVSIPAKKKLHHRLAGTRELRIESLMTIPIVLQTYPRFRVTSDGQRVKIGDDDVQSALVAAIARHRLHRVPQQERERLTRVMAGEYILDDDELVAALVDPDGPDEPSHLHGRLVVRGDDDSEEGVESSGELSAPDGESMSTSADEGVQVADVGQRDVAEQTDSFGAGVPVMNEDSHREDVNESPDADADRLDGAGDDHALDQEPGPRAGAGVFDSWVTGDRPVDATANRFCRMCGEPVRDKARFCGSCGVEIIVPAAAEVDEPTRILPVVPPVPVIPVTTVSGMEEDTASTPPARRIRQATAVWAAIAGVVVVSLVVVGAVLMLRGGGTESAKVTDPPPVPSPASSSFDDPAVDAIPDPEIAGTPTPDSGATTDVAETSTPPDADEIASVKETITRHWNLRAAGDSYSLGQAYDMYTGQLRRRAGQRKTWVSMIQDDGLYSASVQNVKVTSLAPTRARAVAEVETQASATGCKVWTFQYSLVKSAGEWLLSDSSSDEYTC